MGAPIKRGKAGGASPARKNAGGKGQKPAGGGKGGGGGGGSSSKGGRRKKGPSETDVYEIDEDVEAGGERRKKDELRR